MVNDLRAERSVSSFGCDVARHGRSDVTKAPRLDGDGTGVTKTRTRSFGRRVVLTLIAILASLAHAPAMAVVLSDGDRSLNTTAPPDDPGWDNVGVHGGGSAVYLQDRWVLTVDHLDSVETITFQGVPASVDTNSEVVLQNPDGMDVSELTDLRLVRLVDDPGLPAITISSTAPPIDSEVLMIGRGRNREDDLTLWNVSTFGGETTWTEAEFPPFSRSGYVWQSDQTMRWGTNRVVDDVGLEDGASEFDTDLNIVADLEGVQIISLATRFEEINDFQATDSESHATRGDSGGGVFYDGNGQWELAGIMFAVANSQGQPEEAAVFGNATLWADLTFYREQIENIIVSPVLEAGDADQNLSFDQLDLVRVAQSAKYLTGQPATWGDGDWNGAPGGQPGRPPAGDGVFNQFDIIASQTSSLYLTGPYAADGPGNTIGRSQASVIYDAGTGELAVDVPSGVGLTSINIDSAAAIFDANPAENLAGLFDVDSDQTIFKATFGSSFSSLSFGKVAAAGLDEAFVRNDLSVVGSLAGGGPLENVQLVYVAVPEPSTNLLLTLGFALFGRFFHVLGRANGRQPR